MEGRGAPVKCSITSQLDFLEGVWGVRGVLGVCGWEDGVEDLEPGGSRSNSILGFPPSFAATCCRRLAHLLVLLTDPVTDLAATSPCANKTIYSRFFHFVILTLSSFSRDFFQKIKRTTLRWFCAILSVSVKSLDSILIYLPRYHFVISFSSLILQRAHLEISFRSLNSSSTIDLDQVQSQIRLGLG